MRIWRQKYWRRALVFFVVHTIVGTSLAQDVSAPAMLQMFEARWHTIDSRMADIFKTGYGGLWLPPPNRADSGGLSVGYDVFDRFDLGAPRNETLYGTEGWFRALVDTSHSAGMRVHTDHILNHNGFRDLETPGFEAQGDYPGFSLSYPDDPWGDFHPRNATGEELFRLSGLIDIAQEKNHQYIRHPVDPTDPLNIPSGSVWDQADPNNARFYPDQGLGGTTVFNPATNQNVTLYDFNTSNPLQGDAVAENATGLLLRQMRWMIQDVGVDGFRLDATRHFPRWVLDFVDEAVFLADKTPLLDGSQDHPFLFSETGFDNVGALQTYIRKDINPNDLGTVGGNRDALDFNLFGALVNNLTDNGFQNDWRNIRSASIDGNDDGFADNGSQGVAFARSHDELGAYLGNVAHAYVLMRPGNAIVYMNAKEFGDNRDFPRGGRDDALGGINGDAVTKLVELRNSHGRGNFQPRTASSDEKELMIYEREASAVVALNNRLDNGFDTRTIQTAFAPGTPLVELTGNAANPLVDPDNSIPDVVTVDGSGQISISIPRNKNVDGVEHGQGYVIYGVSGPEGALRLTDSDGVDITSEVAGATPTATNFGTARLADIPVVTGDSFNVRLETDAVTVGGIRDRQADGDYAVLQLDAGTDINGDGVIDNVTPGSVTYGFEEFNDINQPGFFDPSGQGVFQQAIDSSNLAEGMHYINARAFRHRDPTTTTDNDPSTAGDGGVAVFTDFREAIYVDRLPPETVLESFESYSNFDLQRDVLANSVDGTADSMHIFLNIGAARTDAELLAMAAAGQGRADHIDDDQFSQRFNLVPSGNNVITLVTFEITGNYSIQRLPGQFVDTERGAGIGDLTFDGQFSPADMTGIVGSFEDVLYSENSKFNPAADTNADGLVDTRDLLELCQYLIPAGADQLTLDALRGVIVRRGDLDMSGMTDVADIDALIDNFGPSSDWLFDFDVDGDVDTMDLQILLQDVLGTLPGDANLDGTVDGLDFILWNESKFESGTTWATGDFNGDGVSDGLDFIIWNEHKFQSGSGGNPYQCNVTQSVPEPCLSILGLCLFFGILRARSGVSSRR